MKLFKDGRVNENTKKKLIEKYPSLTEDDFNEEHEEKLLIHLQQKLGKQKDDMKTIIQKL